MNFKFFQRWMHGSRELADDFIRSGIEDWSAEGHLNEEATSQLRTALATPEVAAVTANLGAHMAMSIPLRFPLGSLARFFWTLVARIRAQWPAIRGNAEAREQCSIHTVPVMLLGLVPGFGAGAYLLAAPLRENPALAAIIFDRLLRKVPGRLYGRLHLVQLTTWWARSPVQETGDQGPSSVLRAVRVRVATLKRFWGLITAVLVVNAVALALAAFLHLERDVSWALSEFGFLNSLDAAELMMAGLLGALSFRLFWRGADKRASHAVRAGIFLWGVVGLGLMAFALDDFFGIHERTGGWIERNADLIPAATNNADDIITLMYGVIGLAVLAVFRKELFAVRASAALLVAGVLAAGMMLGTDAFGRGFVKTLEFPSQVTAVGLLNREARPTREQIREALAENICRCGTYQRIQRAIERAAEAAEAAERRGA